MNQETLGPVETAALAEWWRQAFEALAFDELVARVHEPAHS